MRKYMVKLISTEKWLKDPTWQHMLHYNYCQSSYQKASSNYFKLTSCRNLKKLAVCMHAWYFMQKHCLVLFCTLKTESK